MKIFHFEIIYCPWQTNYISSKTCYIQFCECLTCTDEAEDFYRLASGKFGASWITLWPQ